MNNLPLVISVFFIGFGWGTLLMYICVWEKTKKLFEHCTRILKLQKNIMESDENIQKKIILYADLTKSCFDASYGQTGKVIKYLGEIAEAAKAEAAKAEEQKKNVEM